MKKFYDVYLEARGGNILEESIIKRADEIQKDCHEKVSKIITSSDSNISVQDATNVYLFYKIAELEIKTKTNAL